MSNLLTKIRDVGFTDVFATIAATIDTQLQAVDAVAPVPSERRPVYDLISTLHVSGSDAAPVIDIRWRARPATHGSALATEAVVEAALRAGIASLTITHDGNAATFGVVSMTDLGTALGF